MDDSPAIRQDQVGRPLASFEMVGSVLTVYSLVSEVDLAMVSLFFFFNWYTYRITCWKNNVNLTTKNRRRKINFIVRTQLSKVKLLTVLETCYLFEHTPFGIQRVRIFFNYFVEKKN